MADFVFPPSAALPSLGSPGPFGFPFGNVMRSTRPDKAHSAEGLRGGETEKGDTDMLAILIAILTAYAGRLATNHNLTDLRR